MGRTGRFGRALVAGSLLTSLYAAPALAADVDPPVIYLDQLSPAAVLGGASVTVSATAYDETALAAADVQVDGGPWLPMQAVDGAFDSTFEEATAAVTAPLAVGSYEVCVRATDAAANASDGFDCGTLTVSPPPPDPLPIAQAMAAGTVTVTGASWVAIPVGVTTAQARSSGLGGFPLAGSSFGILSTGDVADVALPGEFASTDVGGANVRGDTDLDVTILKIDLTIPPAANCLAFGFRFLSEEYPDFVGTPYNDAFVAEIDGSTWTTAGSTISAPNNIAFDGSGDVVSINLTGLGEMTPAAGAGTAFDGTAGAGDPSGGATGILGAAVAVTPGAHSLYLSLFDQGDRILDSAVFVDNIRSLTVADPVVGCGSGAVLAPVVTTHPLGQTVAAGATATFTAASTPAAPVQWQVLAPGGSWTNIAGATSTTLSFTAQLADDQKQYQAIFSNAAGDATTNAATLTVAETLNSLTVSKTGTGAGTVTSSPAGIACGATCEASFSSTATVTLTAAASAGSSFSGWSGSGCSGTGTCVVAMSEARIVTASFADLPPIATLTASASPTKAATLTYTLTFNEPVTGLAAGDFGVTGTATGCTVDAPSGSGTAYTVTVSGCSEGTVVLSLSAGSVQDALATAGPPAPATAATVTIDRTGPGVSAVGLAPSTVAAAGTVTVTATATDPSGVAGAEVSVDGGAFVPMSSGDGAFGGTSEGLTASIAAPASPGSYQVCVRATDVPGTTTATPSCATLTVLATHLLTVSRAGTGAGTITSSPAGITCGATCAASFVAGTTVTLTAFPTGGATFDGWTGAGCSGTGTCVIVLNAAESVTGTFTASTDTTPPTATAPTLTPRTNVPLSGSALPVIVGWTGTDTGGSGIAGFELSRSTDGGATWTPPQAVAGGSITTTVPTGGTVRFRVRAVDVANNTGSWATSPVLTPRLVQQTSSAITYKGTWSKQSSSKYSGGSVRYATKAGASATYKVTGRSIALVTTKSPKRGKVKVYVNGALAATIDLRSTSTTYRVVAWQRTFSTSATRTIKLVVVGTSGRPRVDLDAFGRIQ